MEKINKKTKAGVIRFGRFRYLAAAVILAIILAMCFMPVTKDSKFLLALEDKVSRTLEMFSIRGAGEQDNQSIPALKNCMKQYNAQNYTAAIDQFENFIANYPTANNLAEAKLYLGVSYLNNNQAAQANELLYELSAQEDFSLQEDALWYLGFSYVFLRDLEAAKIVFNTLTDSKQYGIQAQAMLDTKKTNRQTVVFK